jgi:hypothetical protein
MPESRKRNAGFAATDGFREMIAFALRLPATWRAASRVSVIPVLLPAVMLVASWAAPAMAQAPAWPTDNKQQQAAPGGPAWPTDNGPPARQQTSAPGGFGPPQGGMAAPGGFGPPGGAPPGGGEAQAACVKEFDRLRSEVEKKGKVARAISDRKGSREELCGAMNGIFAAEGTWIKYAKNRAAACGIPPEIIKQLGQGHDHLAQMRKQVCSAGVAGPGPARPPSLAEALGTTRLPDNQNTTVKRGGTLDTLTGNPIR